MLAAGVLAVGFCLAYLARHFSSTERGPRRLGDTFIEYPDEEAVMREAKRKAPPEAGVYVVRPPGQHAPRKVRVLAELLIEFFGKPPHLARTPGAGRTA